MTSSRTSKKAIVHMLEFLKEEMNENYQKLHVRICSHNSIEYANKLKEEILSTYRNVIITVSEYIGPVFNVHVGPKGFGLSFFTE
jgi:fatty acid-binding protein DegV